MSDLVDDRESFDRLAYDAGYDTRIIWRSVMPDISSCYDEAMPALSDMTEYKEFSHYASRETQRAYSWWCHGIAQNAEAAKRLRALEMAMDVAAGWDEDARQVVERIREDAEEIMRGESK